MYEIWKIKKIIITISLIVLTAFFLAVCGYLVWKCCLDKKREENKIIEEEKNKLNEDLKEQFKGLREDVHEGFGEMKANL